MAFVLDEKLVGGCVEKDSEDASKSVRKELHEGRFMSVMIQEGQLCGSCCIILILVLWFQGLLNRRAVFCFVVINSLLGCQQVWDSMFPSLGTYQHLIYCYLWLFHFFPCLLHAFIFFLAVLTLTTCEVCLLENYDLQGCFLLLPKTTAYRCANWNKDKVFWTKGASGDLKPECTKLFSHLFVFIL